jgi:hypothetical protein
MGQLFWNFGGRICQILDELPVCTRQKKYENDVDQEKKKISMLVLISKHSQRSGGLLFKERVFHPAASPMALEICKT